MRREEMERLCGDLRSGEAKYVENMKWRYTGRVIACGEDEIRVDAFGHHFEWPVEICRETRGDVGRLGPPSNR